MNWATTSLNFGHTFLNVILIPAPTPMSLNALFGRPLRAVKYPVSAIKVTSVCYSMKITVHD
jgi:hypothetical protein